MKVTNKQDTQNLELFRRRLVYEEKSAVTTEKYCRDAAAFCLFVNGRPITKELVIAYKENLIDRGYAVRSINSMIASVNSYLRFLGREECKVKNIRTRHQTYCPEEKILTKEDYRLLLAAFGKACAEDRYSEAQNAEKNYRDEFFCRFHVSSSFLRPNRRSLQYH